MHLYYCRHLYALFDLFTLIVLAQFDLTFLAFWKCRNFRLEVSKEVPTNGKRTGSCRRKSWDILYREQLIDQLFAQPTVFLILSRLELCLQFLCTLPSYFLHNKNSVELSNKKYWKEPN